LAINKNKIRVSFLADDYDENLEFSGQNTRNIDAK